MDRIGNNKPEDKNPSLNYEEEQKKISEALSGMPVSSVDAAEKDNTIDLVTKPGNDDEKGAFNLDEEPSKGHQNLPVEFYEEQATKGMQPAIEVTNNKAGFSPRKTAEQIYNLSQSKTFRELSQEEREIHYQRELAKPATVQDLSNLDESMIMNLPGIKATSFKIIDMLNPKPKDPNIRFKWANCKNNIAGNLGRYIALGFKVASVDDVDQNRTPIDASMIDGTQVKYYDVVLLKINILELMGLYKSNIIRSIMRLGKVREKGMAEARRQFASDIGETPGATNAYNKIKEALGGKDPVEFFTPGMEESEAAQR